ncbi:helix-turn-helix transcriptional regulator [Priestia endophytica]|uniref:helix-turn-helix transcriptional regulator n=1 Tax=Priestia endophytica TaxID=135735 RepID=UPI000F536C15|nr:helix-turn-helix domain-containing protein [Priestia endophytica]RPK15731.1 hypothetical protein FH5_01166 [Priestia endophytica]
MEEVLKLSSILGDPTRFNIYNHLKTTEMPITAQEVSEKFHIHPNVARSHLTKLEDSNLIISEAHKTGKGGRPRLLYKLSDHLTQLTFSYDVYQLLSNLLLCTISTFGEEGKEALYKTAIKMGIAYIKDYYHQSAPSKPIKHGKDKIFLIKEAAEKIGMRLSIQGSPDYSSISLHISRCPFQTIVPQNEELTRCIHRSFVQGMIYYFFKNATFSDSNKTVGLEAGICTYSVEKLF